MFDDDVIARILLHPDTKEIPINYQAIMIRVIEQILSEKEVKDNATIS